MSDEQAFLNVLAQNPVDDLCRLVYADWLEERNHLEQAEYLRLVCRAVETLGTQEEDVAVQQLVATSSNLIPEWRQAAAGRFGLVLWGIPADRKIVAIKLIREILGCGLADAKGHAGLLPNHLPLVATAEDIHRIRERFSTDFHTEIVSCDWGTSGAKTPSPLGLARPYDISCTFYFREYDEEPVPREIAEPAMRDIRGFVERICLPGTVPSNAAVAHYESFSATLLRRIPFSEIEQRLAELRPDAKQIADRHQMFLWLTPYPSRTSTE